MHLTLPSTLALALAACGPETGPEVPDEDLDQLACDFVGVTGLSLHAMSSRELDGLATIEPMDEPWTILLEEEGTSWLRFEIFEPGMLRLYLDQDAGRDLYRDDRPMGLPEAEPVELCPEDIPARYRLDLDHRGVYHLELDATDSSELWLMLLDVGGVEG